MRSSSVVAPDAALVVDPFTPAHAFTFVVWFRWNISNTSDLSNPGLLMLEDSSPPNIPGGNATSPKLMIPYLTPTTTFPGRHAIACQIQDGSHCVRLTAPVASQILDGNYHMIAWQVDGTAKQVKVYFDGVGWGLADTGESGTTAISSIDVNSVIDAMAMFAVGWGPDWQSAATNPTGAAIGHPAYFPSVLASGDLDNIWDAGTLCWDGDTTDERLDRVCDQIGIDPDDRDFDTGTQTCGPTVLASQNALGYLKKINATEAGECFVNGDGKIRFRARPSDTTPVAIFTDLPEGGGGLLGGYPCEAVTPQNDWTRIVNTVEVGIESGASQVVTDGTSAATYGPLSGSVGGKIDTLHQDLGDARATAQFRIDGHKNPTVYIPQIRVSSIDQAVPVSALVGIEVGDFVGVIARPPSPTDEPIQVLAQVEYVQYDFPNPTELVTTYSLGDGIPALFLDVG
jgi:hypothetical protein